MNVRTTLSSGYKQVTMPLSCCSLVLLEVIALSLLEALHDHLIRSHLPPASATGTASAITSARTGRWELSVSRQTCTFERFMIGLSLMTRPEDWARRGEVDSGFK